MEPSTHVIKPPNILVPAWEKRAVTLAAFGLVGLGALVGAISVYIVFLKHRIEEHFRVQVQAVTSIHDLENTSMKGNSSFSNETKKPLESQNQVTKSENVHEESFSFRVSGEDSSLSRRKTDKTVSDTIVPSPMLASSAGDQGGEEIQQFLITIDELLNGSTANQQEAYLKLDANKDKLKNKFEFWWRFGQATHLQATAAGHQNDKDLQKTLLQKAVSYAEKALKLNDRSADAHKWFAISSGSLGEFLSVSEKINNGFVFKQHIDRAVVLNPNDAILHHLLGRFCFEVSQLSWIERRIAATLFAAPPTATVQEALDHFLDSEKIGKPHIENRFFIAKSYIRTSNLERAAYWLKLASQTECVSENDITIKRQVLELLPKYRKYLP